MGRKNPKQTKKQTNKTREKITNINELTFSDTPGSKDGDKGTQDAFLRVTYKRAARYYRYGITKYTTYDGKQNYLRQRGVYICYTLRLI